MALVIFVETGFVCFSFFDQAAGAHSNCKWNHVCMMTLSVSNFCSSVCVCVCVSVCVCGNFSKGLEGVERSSPTKMLPQSRENVPARRAQLRLPSLLWLLLLFVLVVVVVVVVL